MSEKHLVCQGATCQCQFGKTPDKLKVLTQTKRFLNDSDGAKKLIATHMDLGKTFEKNTFGSCAKMNNNPCQVVVSEWKGFYDKVKLEENIGNPLLEDSKATCPIGAPDCISIINHGQTAEISQQNIENGEEESLKLLLPLADIKSKPASNIELNVNPF